MLAKQKECQIEEGHLMADPRARVNRDSAEAPSCLS